MLIKKISNDWKPVEYPNLVVGDVIDFPNPESLIAEGKVEVVTDEPKIEQPKEEEKKK